MSGEDGAPCQPRLPVHRRVLVLCERIYGSSTLSFGAVVAIVMPLFVDQLLLCIINLLNTTMVAGYGETAVSAVSMVDTVNNLVANFFIAVATGCTVLVAQLCGKGDRHGANSVAAQAVGSAGYIALGSGLLLFVFGNGVINLLYGGAEQAILDQAVIYLRGSALSYPFLAVLQCVLGAMRGSGNTRTSLYFSLLANVGYVLVNILTLYGLKMGVLGMAISLVSTRALAAVLATLYMVRSNNEFRTRPSHFLKLNGLIQGKLMSVAIPAGLEQVFFHGGRMLTQIFIVSYGTMSTAANAVANPLSSFQQVIGNSMALAIVPVAGQCIGAHKLKQAKRYIKRMTITGIVGLALSSLILAPLMPAILSIFQLEPEAYDKALRLTMIFLIGTPLFWPTSFIIPAGLRAAGDARFTSVAALTSMWSFRVVMGYIFAMRLGWDVYGVWLAMVLEWGVRSVIFMLRLHGRRWYRHRLV